MELLLDDLTVKTAPEDFNDLMAKWRWLLPNANEILLVSKMGDMFLSTTEGEIYWIATDSGDLTKIADSYVEFKQLLNDKDNIDNWFLPSLVEELIRENRTLKNGQVYGFIKLPVLGGGYNIDNIEAIDISIHFALTGQICSQIKNLPDGTAIEIKLID